MISFPAALGAAAYVSSSETLLVVTQATPLTAAKQMGVLTELWPLCVGTVNGSLGETSAIAALVGGLYLCFRRAAAWQIPAGTLLAAVILAGVGNLINPETPMTVFHHLFGGSLLFGAFFIATDPVTSPLAPLGRFLFGVGIGVLVLILRVFSGYPEGLMFAVLLMNAVVPLINRWTIPKPVGGRVAG
jgi:electron transport complex protein RnfD